uniref:Uncharacterized protein n=1 Tax=Oryza barthii TaxID=65489 RepID=A0A0D3FVI7_9ORYZ
MEYNGTNGVQWNKFVMPSIEYNVRAENYMCHISYFIFILKQMECNVRAENYIYTIVRKLDEMESLKWVCPWTLIHYRGCHGSKRRATFSPVPPQISTMGLALP